MKRNVPILGLIIGLILPMIGMLLLYFLRYSSSMELGEYLGSLFKDGKAGSAIISLCALLNIIPFLYYTSKRLDYTARGLLVATMLYFVLFVLVKFVWN